MEGWKEVIVGELGQVITGNTPPKNDTSNYGGTYPFIKPTDMELDQRYVTQWEENYSETAYQKYKRSYIPPNSTGVVTIGTVGKKIFQSDQYCFTNQSVNVVIPNEVEYDCNFVYYLLKVNLPKVENANPGTASGRHHVSKSSFCAIKVSVPKSKIIQQKIAQILTDYDNLIENNLKRIKLLEEMAQVTFEQWFVRMKFPGHETTSMDAKTGLAEGWGSWCLDKLMTIKHGYAYKGEYFRDEETNRVLLTPGNFKIGGGLKLDKIKYYDEMAESPEGYILDKHDLLVTMTDLSKMADTLGYPLLVPASKSRIYLHNQRLGKVLPVTGIYFPKRFYYMLFQDERYRAFVVGSSSGATVKHTSPTKILAFKPILPPVDSDLVVKFDDLLKPMFELIDLLLQENDLLLEARDILLPRLMTGLIGVDHIELPATQFDMEAV